MKPWRGKFGVVSNNFFVDSIKDFYLENGIKLNPEEVMPVDKYTKQRTDLLKFPTFQTPSTFDKLKRFIEFDRQVLRFYCRGTQGDDERFYTMHVRTMELRYMRGF